MLLDPGPTADRAEKQKSRELLRISVLIKPGCHKAQAVSELAEIAAAVVAGQAGLMEQQDPLVGFENFLTFALCLIFQCYQDL